MKLKTIIKIATDVIMTILLLLLMAYELIGQAAHEWIGIGIFALFILHHILNGKWSRNILKGRYTPVRVFQTLLVICIFLTMIGSMISGVILSRHALSFLSIQGGRSFARTLHMISAYWGFVLMSLHLGVNWSMITGVCKKFVRNANKLCSWTLRVIAVCVSIYGIFAFVKRDIGSYMLLKNQFVFFNFEEPLIFFILDYISVMCLFVFIGYSLTKLLRTRKRKNQNES